jgi:hypothetical protein
MTLDDRLLALTSDALRTHLEGRGWTFDRAVDHETFGAMTVMRRARPDASLDYTAVPLDPTRTELIAMTLAASAARDGLDLAALADELGL